MLFGFDYWGNLFSLETLYAMTVAFVPTTLAVIFGSIYAAKALENDKKNKKEGE